MKTRQAFKVGKDFHFADFRETGFYSVRIPEGETDVDIKFQREELPAEYKEGEGKEIAASTLKALDHYRGNRTLIGRTPGVEEMFFSELRAAFGRKTIAPEGRFDLMRF